MADKGNKKPNIGKGGDGNVPDALKNLDSKRMQNSQNQRNSSSNPNSESINEEEKQGTGKSSGGSPLSGKGMPGMPKIPGMPGGTGSLGGGANLEDMEDAAAKVQKAKKVAKVLKFIGPAIPYILCIFAAIFIIAVVMSQIYIIKQKVANALAAVSIGAQKFENFVTGQGWQTEEEEFFIHLEEEYEQFQRESTNLGSDDIDIPLIASTVHYSKMSDNDIWDGDSNEKESELGSSDDSYKDDSNLFSAFVENENVKSFYKVANTKLGTYRTLLPGARGLIGHMVNTTIGVKTVCINDALQAWKDFFSDLVLNYDSLNGLSRHVSDSVDVKYEVYDQDVKQVFQSLISEIINFTKLGQLLKIKDKVETAIAFANQGQSYTEWAMVNAFYELNDFISFFTGDYHDEKLVGNKLSYYDNLKSDEKLYDDNGNEISEAKSVYELVDQLTGKADKYESGEPYTEKYDENDPNEVPHCMEIFEIKVPIVIRKVDYQSYYRYLVNAYIPATYFHGKTEGVDYNFIEIVQIANEMFDQKEMYEYLFDDVEDLTIAGCGYSYGSDSTIDIDSSMISNLYVNVLGYNESSRKSTNIAETVSLRDYVIGVVYREVGATTSDNEEYLKSFIVAVKSYTLGRPTTMGDGISKGDDGKYYIAMRNNTNDQVYCSITKGCMDAPSNKKAAPSSSLISFLGKLYDEVYNDFLYSSTYKTFVGSYRDKSSTCTGAGLTGACYGQKDAKSLGEKGQNYKSILGFFYTDPIGIADVSTGSFSTAVKQCISSGLELGSNGFYKRTSAPVSSDKYFNSPYVSDSNIGQCVWYVKGRAQEIVDNLVTDPSKKSTAMNAIRNTYGNGNQWYATTLTSVFGSSKDANQPRVGAIGVYDWVSPNSDGHKYGHAVIVEDVSGDSVTISEGWNSCDPWSSSWSCVGWHMKTLSKSQMSNLGRPDYYKFIGYVYLLD